MKLIGKVKDAHGIHGDLYILIFSGDISWAKKMRQFQLNWKKQVAQSDGTNSSQQMQQIMTVKKFRPFKQGLILTAEEIKDRNQAELLKGAEFYIDGNLLISEPGETIFLSEIINYKVKDIQAKEIGTIIGFSSNGAQDLLEVRKIDEQVVLIPFVDAFIKKMDFKNQSVMMELPPGLVDDVE